MALIVMLSHLSIKHDLTHYSDDMCIATHQSTLQAAPVSGSPPGEASAEPARAVGGRPARSVAEASVLHPSRCRNERMEHELAMETLSLLGSDSAAKRVRPIWLNPSCSGNPGDG